MKTLILDGSKKVGEGKVYSSQREMELEKENTALKIEIGLPCSAKRILEG